MSTYRGFYTRVPCDDGTYAFLTRIMWKYIILYMLEIDKFVEFFFFFNVESSMLVPKEFVHGGSIVDVIESIVVISKLFL